MPPKTQYSPNDEMDRLLASAGVSKTVYALVTPETESVKNELLGKAILQGACSQVQKKFGSLAGQLCRWLTIDGARAVYLEQFRDAWTKKQERYHQVFFDTWHKWSEPLVDLDRDQFKFAYPTAGASEPLRHIIYDYGNRARVAVLKAIEDQKINVEKGGGGGANASFFEEVQKITPHIHVFAGEYEGYKAYAEAAGITVIEHDRKEWRKAAIDLPPGELFFISQPSAIDGNVWQDGNAFLRLVSAKNQKPQVIMDMTYVGAIADVPAEKFAVSERCVQQVVFSLSKPFGVYYDRIGGVWSRTADNGLYGNVWFKSVAALQLGTALMQKFDVFAFPRKYRSVQADVARKASQKLGFKLKPCDIYLLASTEATGSTIDPRLAEYTRRPSSDVTARPRICLTELMSKTIGTAGPTRKHFLLGPSLQQRDVA